jgi:hypothetical protein
MNSKVCLIMCLPFIMVSCSFYKKASLSSFEEYQISESQISDLEFVLKKQKLHYLHTDRRIQVNNYQANESTPSESYNVHFQDNILIPKGATGVCIRTDMRYLIIDFGEGIRVPFVLSEEGNYAKKRAEIYQQNYSLSESNRPASLYFDTRALHGIKGD